MKKNLLYFLALICSVSLFTACSDDDEDISPIVGTWNMSTGITDENGVYKGNGPIAVVWESPSTTTVLGMETPVFADWIETLGAGILPQVLKDITFQPDGNIIATYSSAGISLDNANPIVPVWQASPTNYATYKLVGNNQLLLFVNLEQIMATAQTRVDASDLAPVLALLTDGIPFTYELSSDQKSVRLFVDKKVIDKVSPLLALLKDMELPDMGGMEALVSIIIGEITEALKVTTKIEIGLRLTK